MRIISDGAFTCGALSKFSLYYNVVDYRPASFLCRCLNIFLKTAFGTRAQDFVSTPVVRWFVFTYVRFSLSGKNVTACYCVIASRKYGISKLERNVDGSPTASYCSTTLYSFVSVFITTSVKKSEDKKKPMW